MRDFRLLILGLAAGISVTATIVEIVTAGRLWLVFIITLLSAFLILYIAFRIFLVKDIEKIEAMLQSWANDSIQNRSPGKTYFFPKFKKMDESIRLLAAEKQGEINELKKTSHFRREFIANISHELKTPLFSAQGFVHTLLDGAIKDKNVRNRFLKKAAKSLDGLDMLVQDLLTLSQIEIGDIKMHYENFDIQKMTREVVEQLEELADKKSVKLVIKPRAQRIFVFADYMRIQQVMNNLITNAIKYNKEEGTVKVTFRENKNFVVVKVADNGEGIPEEHQGRIFERFYRVDKSRSRRGGGTGLGLAIVKHILEGHNTMIKVNSKVGHGTVFGFKLAKGIEVQDKRTEVHEEEVEGSEEQS